MLNRDSKLICGARPEVVVQVSAYVVGLELAVTGSVGCFEGFDPSAARWFLAWLAAGPLLWFAHRKRQIESERWKPSGGSQPFGRVHTRSSETATPTGEWAVSTQSARTGCAGRVWVLALGLGFASLGMSVRGSAKLGDLPPAMHDEYSHLFQARTFLAGRLWFPSHATMPDLFDQVHVLNEGKFVSRYFPGTGMWIAPFLAAGRPYWGHWLAGALAAMLVFAAGRELAGNICGFVAGLIVALAPGMAVFGNLLLSHHPTLVGLALFVFAFFRMRNTHSLRWASVAGVGLAFALICRPLTAAAVGLSFAIWFAVWWGSTFATTQSAGTNVPKRSVATRERSEVFRLAAAMWLPVALAVVVLLLYDREITGSPWRSPWSLYNEIYTPSHGYGFNNAVRGAKRGGPKVIEPYDRWADNLTLDKALDNAGTRLAASWQGTLGVVPLAMAGVLILLRPGAGGGGWLLLGAVGSLHAAYFAYWFPGILRWHYVFESLIFWALAFGLATQSLWSAWCAAGRHALCVWWLGLGALALSSTYFGLGDRGTSAFDRDNAHHLAMRAGHAEFRRRVDVRVKQRPALVLVEQPQVNFHLDFVINDPALDGPILLGRYRPEKHDIKAIAAAFPGRTIYVFRERTWEIERAEISPGH